MESKIDFDKFRHISAKEVAELEKEGFSTDISPLKEISRFAEFWSIVQAPPWLYFKGATTPGYVCTGTTQSYKVPLQDVINIGAPVRCKDVPTTSYCKITYVVA